MPKTYQKRTRGPKAVPSKGRNVGDTPKRSADIGATSHTKKRSVASVPSRIRRLFASGKEKP